MSPWKIRSLHADEHKRSKRAKRKERGYTSSKYGDLWNSIFPKLKKEGGVAIDMEVEDGYNGEDDNTRRGLLKIAKGLLQDGKIDFAVASEIEYYPPSPDNTDGFRSSTIRLYRINR